MDGLSLILDATKECDAWLYYVSPDQIAVSPPGVSGGTNTLLIIGDDPSVTEDKSVGPKSFSKSAIKRLISGSHTIIASAEVDAHHGAFIASMVAAKGEPRTTTLILTQPKHHAAWARFVRKNTGHFAELHIAPEDFDAATLPGQNIDLRDSASKPTAH